jgi:hypothetical protein
MKLMFARANTQLRTRSSFLLFAFALLAAAVSLPAQNSAKVTARRVVFTRKDNIKSSRQVVVRYPVVSGLPTRAAQQRAQAALSLNSLFKGTWNTSWEEMRKDSWLDEADYEVAYNRNGLLDIVYTISGTGAYPDGDSHHFVLLYARPNRMLRTIKSIATPSWWNTKKNSKKRASK